MSGNSKAGVAKPRAGYRVFAVASVAAALIALAYLDESLEVRALVALAGLAPLFWLARGRQPPVEAVRESRKLPPVTSGAPPTSTSEPEAGQAETGGAETGDTGTGRSEIGRAETRQAELEDTFRKLFEIGPINLALIDQTGAVQEYSRAFGVFANADGALIGAPFVNLFDESDHEALLGAIQAVGAGGSQAPVVARLAEGKKEACAVVFTELQDAPKLIAASIQDVTQEKKLEAQFAQSQKMLAVGQLAGGVAHDFNNLLTAIIGHADLLMLKYSPSDESFADINQIKQNANRAANLVRQLLAFSRQQTLQPRILDIGEALADLGNLLRRLLGAGVTLNLRHGRDVALVKVDRVQLEQVVINLAVNARDAMKGHGLLDISTKMAEVKDTAGTVLEPMPAGSYVRIDVADHGEGIEAIHLARIFEPFFTTKPLGEGTGLGLSTVYGIVKQTGGFIFVDSKVGAGATFSVYLPPHAEAAAPVAEKAVERAQDLTGVGTIMLVEDEDPVRLFGARALRGKGYRVIEASTGEAALKLFEEGEADDVDLLVTDIVMPELDGPSLIAAARAFLPNLPVICVSGYAESAFRDKLPGLENVHFLPKPFTLNQLAGKVKDVIP